MDISGASSGVSPRRLQFFFRTNRAEVWWHTKQFAHLHSYTTSYRLCMQTCNSQQQIHKLFTQQTKLCFLHCLHLLLQSKCVFFCFSLNLDWPLLFQQRKPVKGCFLVSVVNLRIWKTTQHTAMLICLWFTHFLLCFDRLVVLFDCSVDLHPILVFSLGYLGDLAS